mmetsp:Transcript_4077/g.10365  ORF Transcript_4077/g.10365 Transcript_4077/m.10365 type:complete len:185 (+) Transcript_4077:241-795(+)|eukprot:CAMPEP_0181102072 /NCGR_PEP_ID=MMETSP1071-20121207/14112_1 /TAXON_ID=35127 /ORGANISM="Thalassiosira sp., Strain NH16" /LENGTH=184 /DNA_ID=CAMNT_0023185005 /DNA_START=244 /DNA_END=798 /DNA_ORIENTATION=+
MCNFSIDRLKLQQNYLNAGGIAVICIFQSPPESMRQFIIKQVSPPFLLLSDAKMDVYKKYCVKTSKAGLMEGIRRFTSGKPMSNMKIVEKRGWAINVAPEGPQDRLPADFLIDEEGTVVEAFYAESVDQHMPWERIEAFIPESMKCKCNSKDCLSPDCRRANAQIIENFGGIFLGGDDEGDEED